MKSICIKLLIASAVLPIVALADTVVYTAKTIRTMEHASHPRPRATPTLEPPTWRYLAIALRNSMAASLCFV